MDENINIEIGQADHRGDEESPSSSGNEDNRNNHGDMSTFASESPDANAANADLECFANIFGRPCFALDCALIDNLLTWAEKTVPSLNLQERLHTNFTATTRSIVVEWMLKQSERAQCEEPVLATAANLLDRFFEKAYDTDRDKITLVAAVCLMLASKMRESKALVAKDIFEMTNGMYSEDDIIAWERMVAMKVQAKVSVVVANDFVEPVLAKLYSLLVRGKAFQVKAAEMKAAKKSKYIFKTLRDHCDVFIVLCAQEPEFISVKPSVVAAACILAAVCGLLGSSVRSVLPLVPPQTEVEVDSDEHFYHTLVARLQEVLRAKSAVLRHYASLVESIFAKAAATGQR